ncbi:unnamed protein product [Calypogeia fissa]
MPSRDDRTPSFCSERMKICQKHLSNVYIRSKRLLVTSRAGKVVPEVTSSAARGFADGGRNTPKDAPGPGLSKLEKKNLSPYLTAVSGLFDGPSLLKQFQLKKLCGGLAERKLKTTSQADCPQSCYESTTKDSGSAPLFFKENIHVSAPATNSGTFSTKTNSTSKHEGDGYVEPPASSNVSNGSTSKALQTSNGSALSTIPEERTRVVKKLRSDQQVKKLDSSKPSNYKVNDMSKLGSVPSSLRSDQKAFPNVVIPQSSLPSSRQSSLPNGKKPQLLAGTGSPRKPSNGGNGTQQKSRDPDSQQRAGPSKRPGPEVQEKAAIPTPRGGGRSFAKSFSDTGGGASTLADPQSGTFASRLKKGSKNTNNILQASVAKVFGASVGPPKPFQQMLTASQLHDAICDHSTPDCPSFRKRNTPQLAQSKDPIDESNLSVQAGDSGGEDLDPSQKEMVSANEKCSQLALEVRTDMRRQEKSSANLWKYGSMAVCTENPGRDYTTGDSPPDALEVITKKKLEISGFHWSRSGSRKVVNHVAQLLQNNQWGSGVVEQLDAIKGLVNTHCVNAILQQQKDPHQCLAFFKWAQSQHGYKHDVFAFTTMINILGRARNLRGVRHLLEDMHKAGIEPNVATYNTLILCYGKVESLNESIRVFRIMQEAGCKPDNVTYSILIHLCIKAGYLQEALKLYQGMLEAGVQPDTITYSIVIDSLGKSGKLREARKLFREMKERGCVPNEFTYNSIINRHAKARKTQHALKHYTEMRAAGFKLNAVTCTIMMGVLGSLGKFDQAESLFSEMQQSGIVADTAAYSLMINMWGTAGNLDKAVSWYGRMLGSLVTPSLAVFSSLVDAHLKANLYQAAQHFLTSMVMWGINPDLKLYTILLRHCILCDRQEHADAVLGIMDRLGHPAHRFLYELLTSPNQDRNSIRGRVISYFDSADQEDPDNKQGFANALIEFLHKLQCKTDPRVVWETCMEKGIFHSSIVRREEPNHWLVDLHSFSVGTALVGLPRLLVTLRDNWVQNPTKRVYIVTGWGKRSRVSGTSALKQSVLAVLEATKSPFSLDHANAGVFVSYGSPFCDWMSQPLMLKKLGTIALEGVV